MKDKNLSIRDLLKQADIKVIDLAEAFGVARGTVRDRLDNPAKFTVEELAIVAKLLNRPPSSLIRIIMRKITPSDPVESTLTDEES